MKWQVVAVLIIGSALLSGVSGWARGDCNDNEENVCELYEKNGMAKLWDNGKNGGWYERWKADRDLGTNYCQGVLDDTCSEDSDCNKGCGNARSKLFSISR